MRKCPGGWCDNTEQKEKIIDNALLFIKDPSEFWNRAPVQIQKRVQLTIFPEGLVYDFEKGFGTVKVNESYQLIKKIAPEGAKNPIVVAGTRIEPPPRFHLCRTSSQGKTLLAVPLALLPYGHEFKYRPHYQTKNAPFGTIFVW